MRKAQARRSWVPDWAQDAVWYQIFPERFRNGQPANDPTLEDISDRPIAGWRVLPWGWDWYRRDSWEKRLGSWEKSVFHRRFGGDLIGVREKLDYLQDLGINALYLNPIFMAPSLHKYDAACLHHVDPTLGPDRDGDLALLAKAQETDDPQTWVWTAADRYFLELVAEIHSRGMRVILDGVFNHAGTRFFAFQDLLKKGKASRYRDWFRITRWRDDGTFEYQGWFNHAGLPEFARTARDLAPPVKRYLFDITRRWMDPNGDGDPSDGVDGWRLDVAFCVPHGFWKQWRRWVKSINPHAYLTGEVVGYADDFLKGDEFDGVMNYMWLYPVLGFFSPSPRALTAQEMQRRLDELWARHPPAVCRVLQNLLDSHDTGRVLTMLENACPPFPDWDSFFQFPRAMSNPALRTTRPGPKARAILRTMILFQMTCVGAPMLYYGTEVGMWGANDPDNRQPMLWADIRYQAERHTLSGRCAPTPRAPDLELHAFVRQAIALRRAHRVLRRGQLRWVSTEHPRLLAYDRLDRSATVRVWINASDETLEVHLPWRGQDLWTGRPARPGRLRVEPHGWRVISRASAA